MSLIHPQLQRFVLVISIDIIENPAEPLPSSLFLSLSLSFPFLSLSLSLLMFMKQFLRFLFQATVFVIVRKYKSDSHVFCLSVCQSSINICSPHSGSWDTIHPLHLHLNQSINQSIINKYLPTQAVGIVSVFFICTSIN